MIIVYVTCKDKHEAEKISRILLEKKLIGCANIFPIDSMYLWKGKIVRDKEYAIIAKALMRKHRDIHKEIKKHHSYTIPSIDIIPTKANKEFVRWLKEELRLKPKQKNI